MHALSFFAEGLEDAHTAAKRGGGVARHAFPRETEHVLATHSLGGEFDHSPRVGSRG